MKAAGTGKGYDQERIRDVTQRVAIEVGKLVCAELSSNVERDLSILCIASILEESGREMVRDEYGAASVESFLTTRDELRSKWKR